MYLAGSGQGPPGIQVVHGLPALDEGPGADFLGLQRSRGSRLTQECGDEDTGVQVEGGMPPAVGEVQDLSRADGALDGPLPGRQERVRVQQPGQSSLVGVELRGFLRGIQKPALPAEDHL